MDKVTEKKGPSGRKKVTFYLIINAVFLVFLLMMEGLWRLATPYIPPIKYFVSGTTHSDDPDGAATFEGDPLLGWRLKAGLRRHWWDFTLFSTNVDHLRHPREVHDPKPEVKRIVCLGDSVTFGYRVPVSYREKPLEYNPEDLPYPRLLENRLRAGHPGKDIEVIALAVPGYSSHQGLAWIRRDIDTYKPDLVITSYGWNDTDFRQLEDKVTLPVHRHRVWFRRLVSFSQIGIYLARWSASRKMESGPTDYGNWVSRVSTRDYLDNMAAIASVAEQNAAGIIIVGQVYRDSVTNPRQAEVITRNREKLSEMCRVRNIRYLQIDQLTEKAYPRNASLFGEVIHPDAKGHRLMADKLLELIEKDDLLGLR